MREFKIKLDVPNSVRAVSANKVPEAIRIAANDLDECLHKCSVAIINYIGEDKVHSFRECTTIGLTVNENHITHGFYTLFIKAGYRDGTRVSVYDARAQCLPIGFKLKERNAEAV